MLLDICDHSADLALESIFKAQNDEPPGLWEPHQNPYIARIVDLFTSRGLRRIENVELELQRWLSGSMLKPSHERPMRPTGNMARWSKAELELTKLYLQSLPPAEFTFDDWSMLIDYLVQRYLPPDDMRSESEWLSTRAALMGRLESAHGPAISQAVADEALAAASAAPVGGAVASAVVAYGSARCAENVVALTDSMRHRLKRTVMADAESRLLGNREPHALQTKLVDDFGALNRDWRRIALTEAGEIANQGLILSLAHGRKVKRVEKYDGACAFCRSIDGRVLEVVDASSPTKNWNTQIWSGKTNFNRFASPRRADGSERPQEERYTIPAGLVHPNCRGGWVVLGQPTRSADPEFSKWMDEQLGRAA